MRVAADTAFFIALFRKQDEQHERAKQLALELKGKNAELLATTHVVDETATYIHARDGAERAYTAVRALLEAASVSIETPERKELDAAAEIMRKYQQLSFCDSLTVAIMRKHGIASLVSFDKGFDHVEKLSRIH